MSDKKKKVPENFRGVFYDRRDALEQFLKKAVLWERISGLTLAMLAKLIDDEATDKIGRNGLLEFAVEENKVSVRLVKKREDDKD